MKEIRYVDIVPEEYQELLIQIGSDMTKNSWSIGWITNEIMIYSEAEYGRMAIYAAVGAFCGKSARTVREYHLIWKFYADLIDVNSPEWEGLSFDHFRAAMQFGENAVKALKWCNDQTIHMGRPATVDAMILRWLDDVSEDVDSPFQMEARSLRVRLVKFISRFNGDSEIIRLAEQLIERIDKEILELTP